MGDFFLIPAHKVQQLRAQLGETHAYDAQSDTKLACNIVTTIAHDCVRLTAIDPVLGYEITRSTPDLAVLRLTNVPSMTLTGLTSVDRLGSSVIAKVQCLFVDELTQERAPRGCVEVTFWRAAASAGTRQRLAYAPQQWPLKLAPFAWTGLHVDDEEDRKLVLAISRSVYGMARITPRITLAAANILKPLNALSWGNGHAQPRTGSRKRSHRSNDTASDSDATATDDARRVGIVLYFGGIGNVDGAFMQYLKATYPAIIEITVVAFSTWVRDDAPPPPEAMKQSKRAPLPQQQQQQVLPQELVISLRLMSHTEAESGPYAVEGAERLSRMLTRVAEAFANARDNVAPVVVAVPAAAAAAAATAVPVPTVQ